ncbi:putative hydrolase of the HAD superfamily [Actinoplanes campanulatus]|uniref:Putative hydrolase of the HAD superfamily n=1 Tax=Actinoplanes campanulatus TaxID=113559 RepID=A0A7W5FG93_9ACTN|nr:HAD family hydrolase [Actinoplanes campanulatus]MBB3097212.1 putative hydrolase of the HAD superfamily [Actinoplanes campanulatus]
MRAVIFDFFGTLTDPAAEALRPGTFGETAAALGVPAEPFRAAMVASFPQRIVGAFGGTRETLRTMAHRCGAEPDDERLDHAVATHHAGAERLRTPRRDALAVLDHLRAQDFRLGLLSDCASELSEAWPGTVYADRIDAPVFSWREGRRKPDPRLYAVAAERLGVPAAECWFVGDGGGREHDGARRAGMRPVLVTNAAYPGAPGMRVDPDTYLPEHRIDELDELIRLLGTACDNG